MPAKPPKMPKNATQEQLDEYSKTLEQEDVWREEADKLDKRRVELAEERRRLEKLAIELEKSKGAGGGKGEDEMLKFMQQQQDLLTKITSLEEKRKLRESEESERLKLKDSIGRRSETSNLQRRQGRKTRSPHPKS